MDLQENCALISSQVNDIEIAYWSHVYIESILFLYVLGVMSVLNIEGMSCPECTTLQNNSPVEQTFLYRNFGPHHAENGIVIMLEFKSPFDGNTTSQILKLQYRMFTVTAGSHLCCYNHFREYSVKM